MKAEIEFALVMLQQRPGRNRLWTDGNKVDLAFGLKLPEFRRHVLLVETGLGSRRPPAGGGSIGSALLKESSLPENQCREHGGENQEHQDTGNDHPASEALAARRRLHL